MEGISLFHWFTILFVLLVVVAVIGVPSLIVVKWVVRQLRK